MNTMLNPILPMYTVDKSNDQHGEYIPLGLVLVNKIEGLGVFREFFARIKDLIGGTVRSYSRPVMSGLIFPALRELSDEAHRIYTTKEYHPDAIMGLIIETKELSGKGMSMMMCTVYGTAVQYVKREESLVNIEMNERVEPQVA